MKSRKHISFFSLFLYIVLYGLLISSCKSTDDLIEEGIELLKDDRSAEAFDVFQTAARRGNAKALLVLAEIYSGNDIMQSFGVEQDTIAALRYLKKAVRKEYPAAWKTMGDWCHRGTIVKKDALKAKECYLKVIQYSENDSLKAVMYACLGDLYSSSDSTLNSTVPKDYKTANEYYELAAKTDTLYAYPLLALGESYHFGRGVIQDDYMAFEYFSKASRLQYTLSYFRMGEAYQDGKGVERDYQKSFEWFEKGANENDSYCYFALGLAYELGRGVSVDYHKAVEYYKKGAKLDSPGCIRNLGFLYYNGHGVEKNYVLAFNYMLQAAQMGDPWAMCYVGVYYYNGIGTIKDAESAKYWIRNSIEQDLVDEAPAFYNQFFGN